MIKEKSKTIRIFLIQSVFLNMKLASISVFNRIYAPRRESLSVVVLPCNSSNNQVSISFHYLKTISSFVFCCWTLFCTVLHFLNIVSSKAIKFGICHHVIPFVVVDKFVTYLRKVVDFFSGMFLFTEHSLGHYYLRQVITGERTAILFVDIFLVHLTFLAVNANKLMYISRV